MSANKKDLFPKLSKARQQLEKAQMRVAALEAQLFTDQSNPTASLTSEDRYHHVLDNLLEGAEIIGFDWRYLYVNDAVAGHGRQPKEVLLRSTVPELYPGIENTEMFAHFRTCMDERIPQHFEANFVFPDGEAAWFELSVQPVPEGIFILSLDITDRKRSEAALKRYAHRMEVLHEIDLKIIEASSIQPLLEVMVKHLRELIPCPRVSAALIDQKTGESVIFALDLDSPSAINEGVRTSLPPDWFEGFGADNTRIINDFRSLPEALPAYQQLIKEGIVTSLQVVLMDRERPIGVLGLSAATPGFFTAEHQEIAAEVARQLTIAIRQLNLFEELAHRATELEQHVVDLKQAQAAVKRYAQRMEILHQIDLGIIQGDSVEAMVEAVLKHIRELIPCQRVSASLTDETKNEMLVFAIDLTRPSAVDKGIRVTLPSGWLDGYDTDHAKIIDDLRLLEDLIPAQKQLLKEGLITFLHVMLTVQGHPIGLLALSTDTPGFFTTEYRQIAIEIANQLAIAIHQMQLSEELERHASELEQNNVDLRQAEAALRRYAQRMEILHQIDSGIISAKSIQEVVETALKHIRRIIPCQRADVMILDDTTGETLIFAMDFDGDTTLGQGVRVPSPPNGFEGYDSRHIRVFDDFRPLQDTMPRARRLINEGLLCAMSVLLMDREGPIGVLGMFADTPGFFTAEHQEIAAEIASQLVIAIHQMRLDEALTRHAAELEQRVIDRTADLTDAKVRVEAILNNSTDGILLVHPDFNIQQTNSAFNSLFACEPDVYFGKALITLVQTDDADKVTNIFQAIAAEQQGKSIEIRALRKDGKVFDAELSLALIKDDGLVCTFRDITERKAQERQLRYQATLQENVTDAVIVADLEFRIQSWNKAAEHIYGWSAEEVVGKATVTILRNEFSSPGERERSTQQLYQQGWWQGEISQHHKDGSTRHILGSVTLVKDENGQPFGIVSVNHDVTERKVQERQLRYLASLQESVVDAVIVTDTEFHIQTWNLGAERIYGWKTDEVIGKAAPDVLQIRVSSTQNLESSSQRFKEQGFLQQETIQQRKDGSDIYILGSATLLADENGIPVGVISVNRDITERKTQERQLRYQATLQQNVSDAVIVTDMEFRIQSWNKAAERIYGWSAEEVVSKATAEVLQTEYPSTIDQAGAIQQLREQGWWQGEVIQHHKDGHLVHILGSVTVIKDENGVPFSVVSVNHDISERIRTQQALEASEQRFKLLVSSMRDYAIIMLGVDGNITSWNPGAELIKGYTAEEVIGRHISLFYTPEDIATGEWQRALKIAESEGHFVGEGWRVRKGGSLFWASLVITALRDSTGQLIGFTKVTRDLTERKQAEVALNAKIKEEREFQDYLKALNEITIELTQIDELDVFYRRAVELGLERMGFERLGLLLYDADTQLAVGTYGTDSQGRLKAEHHIIFDPSSSTSILSRALRHDERFIVDEDTGLYSEAELIGRGWNAAVTLWKGTENLGWLAVDNAVRHVPVSKPLLDVLSLYALTLSTLLVQKRGELALRESEARYRLLAENITDVVVRTNEVGEYIYISASSRTVWGYEPEELIGQPVINFVHPDDLAVIVQAFTESMSRSAPDISQVVRFHHKQGHYIWMETIGRAIRSEKTGEIEGFISSSRDISDRKAAEEALRESEEKFRLLLDAAPVATIITDATGRITLANVQADNLFGYNRAELVGQSVDILLPDSARGRHADNRASYLAAPRVRQMGMGMELSAQRKDGSEFPVEIELSYIETRAGLLVMSFVVDITERKRVAAELERQRIFLRQVIDVSPSMIFVKDYDSRFVLVNPMVAKMYNTSVEALIGKTTADFNHAQIEVDGFLEADRRVITSGESLDIEEPVTNYSGETRWFHTVKVPIVSLDGKTKHVLGVATDITEHRKSEETLRQAFEKEKELGELKSRFVSMASHEFRTPLATILALTETLMAYRHKLLDAEIEERLIKIQNQIGHLRDIMDDVLLLARMQARRVDFNPVKINLDSLCRSVIDEFQSRPDVTQRLGYSCDEQLQEIILDKKLMRQIINNLVSNAVKYSTADSSITITLEFENDTLIFKVVDQGIGIPEADLKHLFEPFHRAENVGAISGTGLGLVITKESVELHNGTIAVESQVGIGTTFLVSIPLTK